MFHVLSGQTGIMGERGFKDDDDDEEEESDDKSTYK